MDVWLVARSSDTERVLHGIAQVRPRFVYDHVRILRPHERLQYDMRRQNAPEIQPVGHLFFGDVAHAIPLPQTSSDELLDGQRRKRKHWMRVYEAAWIVFESLAPPAWCSQIADVAVYLPCNLAQLCSDGSLPSFSLLDGWPRGCVAQLPGFPAFPPRRE